jgi:hypothetical protein
VEDDGGGKPLRFHSRTGRDIRDSKKETKKHLHVRNLRTTTRSTTQFATALLLPLKEQKRSSAQGRPTIYLFFDLSTALLWILSGSHQALSRTLYPKFSRMSDFKDFISAYTSRYGVQSAKPGTEVNSLPTHCCWRSQRHVDRIAGCLELGSPSRHTTAAKALVRYSEGSNCITRRSNFGRRDSSSSHGQPQTEIFFRGSSTAGVTAICSKCRTCSQRFRS